MTNSVIQKIVVFVFFGIVVSGCALEDDSSVTAKKDIAKPNLTEVTSIPTSTNDTTPDYTFSSDEEGTITYGGSCSSITTSVSIGNNTITLNTLSDGTYSDCTINVTDNNSNVSNNLTITSFTIDTTTPTVSTISPIDNASEVSVESSVSITFSETMATSTVTTNTSDTSCSGSLMVSSDNFSSCVKMSSSPVVSNSNKTFSSTPSDNFSYSTTYKIRVSTGVEDTSENSMANTYETSSGFHTYTWVGTQQLGTISNDYGKGVTLDSSGNIYVTGYTGGGLDNNTSSSSDDIFLVKYNSSGSKQWAKQLGTSAIDYGEGVSVDSSNNIYVVANTYGGLDGNTHSGVQDFALVKYNSLGDKQWTKQLGTPYYDYVADVSVDSSNNVYLTGHTGGGLPDGNSNSGAHDIFLVKYYDNGTKQWTKLIGTSSWDYGTGVTVDSSDNIYVAGNTQGNLVGSNAGGNDMFLVKYYDNGTKQWTKQLGSNNNEYVTGVSVDSSDNIYVTGYTSGGLDGNTNSGSNDIFLVKYNSSGTKQWTKQLGTSSDDGAQEVTVDSSDNIYVTGYTAGGLDGNTNSGGMDIFLVKYNSSGVKQWTKQLGTSSNDIANGVAVDSFDNIYVTGYTGGGLDGNTNAGVTDLFLVKYNSDGYLQTGDEQMGGSFQGTELSLSAVVTTLAGTGSQGSANGTGTSASFVYPTGITTDRTNLYVADTSNHLIRQIVISTGVVTTLAGTGSLGSANGTGTSASLNSPSGITTDGTNLYVADTGNHLIRQIVISTGVVTTLAGIGSSGSSNGTGTSASFSYPHGIITDGTNLYVADTDNHLIRQIVISTGVVTTLAGTGSSGSANGTGTSASFYQPFPITTDGTNLFVADWLNHLIRKIVISTGVVTTLAGTGSSGSANGTGTSASFYRPSGITTDGTNLYVGGNENHLIRKVVISTGVVTTLAGTGSSGSANGTGTSSSFRNPAGITTDGTNLYVVDKSNHLIRQIE